MMLLLKIVAGLFAISCIYLLFCAIRIAYKITRDFIDTWKTDKKEFYSFTNIVGYIWLMLFALIMIIITGGSIVGCIEIILGI